MARVLLLNASFEPLQLVTAKRAVLLVLVERAEVVVAREDAPVFHSPSLDVTVPSIVRLRSYVKVPFRATQAPLSRRGVLMRDRSRCAYCDGHADTIDHVVPRSRGGRHEWTNVVAACKRHNLQKGDRMLHEIGWELLFEPYVPAGLLWRWRHLGEVDPLWGPYLGEALPAA
jgi:5-methylcytosine-specific restriction endonuclease McrA